MREEVPILRVRMLGGEEITYQKNPVLHSRNSMTRSMKLLLILLYHLSDGIARNRLLEELYGRKEVLDGANSLRVACHRLKKILLDAGLPEYEYISVKNGIYRFEAPVKIEIDAHIFRELIERAGREKNPDKKIKLLKKACHMYNGEFLKDFSGEEWVLIESLHYKNLYTEALLQVCEYLKEQREYEEILKICEPACELYPFDEWQSVRIDCFIALNQYKEALKEYEDTANLFFVELGISPSERMMNQLKAMSGHISKSPQDIREIKGNLREETMEEGAYYCSLPSFRDGYRLVRRIMERNGQSIYLMLYTITDGNGHPMESSEKLTEMSEQLFEAIKHSLRRCDSFTRYNSAQFLILLVGTNRENCEQILHRIQYHFSREHHSWSRNLEGYISSVADMEQEKMGLAFDKWCEEEEDGKYEVTY